MLGCKLRVAVHHHRGFPAAKVFELIAARTGLAMPRRPRVPRSWNRKSVMPAFLVACCQALLVNSHAIGSPRSGRARRPNERHPGAQPAHYGAALASRLKRGTFGDATSRSADPSKPILRPSSAPSSRFADAAATHPPPDRPLGTCWSHLEFGMQAKTEDRYRTTITVIRWVGDVLVVRCDREMFDDPPGVVGLDNALPSGVGQLPVAD